MFCWFKQCNQLLFLKNWFIHCIPQGNLLPEKKTNKAINKKKTAKFHCFSHYETKIQSECVCLKSAMAKLIKKRNHKIKKQIKQQKQNKEN